MQAVTAKEIISLLDTAKIKYQVKDGHLKLECKNKRVLANYESRILGSDLEREIIRELWLQDLKQYKAGAALEFLQKQNYYEPEKEHILPEQSTKQEEPKSRRRILSWLVNLFRREKI